MVYYLKLAVLRIGNFIAQYHFYIIAYIVSSYLAQFVGVANVGYVFVASSILVALVLYAAPAIFRSFGTRNVISFLTFLEVGVLLALAVTDSWVPAVILVTLQSALAYAIFIGIDLLIEASIKEESVTGSTRTSYLTITNFAVLLGALSISFIIIGDQYWRAFVSAALVLLPFLAMSLWFLPRVSFVESAPTDGNLVAQLRTNRSLSAISFAHFLLQMFFSWMGIYIPILLFSYIGFSWSEIGIIIGIGILPYVLFQYPLGFIADKWIGEKEILTVGFGIIILSLFAMVVVDTPHFWWWAGLMFFSRIGAAAVEAMTEVHFFRHVNEKDTSTITFFRVLRPLGNVAGPLIGSLALLLLPLQTTFALFGAIMMIGIPVALAIQDSK